MGRDPRTLYTFINVFMYFVLMIRDGMRPENSLQIHVIIPASSFGIVIIIFDGKRP
jgi:hypothetical protein